MDSETGGGSLSKKKKNCQGPENDWIKAIEAFEEPRFYYVLNERGGKGECFVFV